MDSEEHCKVAIVENANGDVISLNEFMSSNESNCSAPSLIERDELSSVESEAESDLISKHPSLKDKYVSFDSEEQSSEESSTYSSMPDLCAKNEDSSDDDSSYCSMPTFLVEDENNDFPVESNIQFTGNCANINEKCKNDQLTENCGNDNDNNETLTDSNDILTDFNVRLQTSTNEMNEIVLICESFYNENIKIKSGEMCMMAANRRFVAAPEIAFALGDFALWLLDSGATSHFTPRFDDLIDPQPLNPPVYIRVADGSRLTASHVGTVELHFISEEGKRLCLRMLRVLLYVEGL